MMIRRCGLAAALAFGLATGALAQGAPGGAAPLVGKVAFPGGVTASLDITYATPQGYRPLKLDLYTPAPGGAPKPAVIWLHGGGWFGGNPRAGSNINKDFPADLAAIAAKGYVVAGVSYRLSSEAKFPAQIQDVKSAVRWLRANAATYNIDPTRIVVWGGSAGGQLAVLEGTSCGVAALEPPAAGRGGGAPPAGAGGGRGGAPGAGGPPPAPAAPVSDCVQGVIGWYPLTDLKNLDPQRLPNGQVHNVPDSPESRYLGCNLAECPLGVADSASAVTYVDPTDPPFLLMAGDSDVLVSPKQSQELYDALRAKGVKAEIVIVPGAGHTWANATPEQGKMIMDKVQAFLDQTVGDKRPR